MPFELERLIIRIVGDNAQFDQTMRNTADILDSVGRVATRAGIAMAAAFGIPIVAGIKESVNALKDFDSEMTKSTAIMKNVTAEMREELESVAMQMAGDNIKSAEELAEAYFFLTSAGLSVEENLKALPIVTEFAQAGMFDMAKATDLSTDALSALGLMHQDAQGNAYSTAEKMENLRHVTDTLTEANQLANATVEQFSTALTTKAGAAAKAYGQSLEDVTSVLAVMADQGIKGQRAGTEYDRVMRLLTKAGLDNKDTWEQLGFTMYRSTGEMRHMSDIVGNLERVLEGMGTEMRAATLDALGFQARVQQVILPLLGTSNQMKDYREEMDLLTNTTRKVSDAQKESLAAQLAIMYNRFKNLGIVIGKVLEPALRQLIKTINEVTNWFISWPKWLKITALGIGLVLVALAALTLTVGAASYAMAGLTAAFSYSTLAVFAMTGATWTFIGSMIALLPYIAAVIAVVFALKLAWEGMKKIAFNIESQFHGNIDAMDAYNNQMDRAKGQLTEYNQVQDRLLKQREKEAIWISAMTGSYKDYNRIIKQTSNEVKGYEGDLSRLKNELTAAQSTHGDTSTEVQILKDEIAATEYRIKSHIGYLQKWRNQMDKVNDKANEFAEATKPGQQAVEELEEDLQKQIDTFGMSANQIKIWEAENEKGASTLQTKVAVALAKQLEQMDANTKAAEDLKQAQESLRKDGESWIESLKQQENSLRMGADAARLADLAKRGLNKTELDTIRNQLKIVNTLKKEEELRKKGQKLQQKNQSVQEKIDAKSKELQELLSGGFLDLNSAESELMDFIEKTIPKEKKIKISFSGPDALEAGSIAALNKIGTQRVLASQGVSGRGAKVNAAYNKEQLDLDKARNQRLNDLIQSGVILRAANLGF